MYRHPSSPDEFCREGGIFSFNHTAKCAQAWKRAKPSCHADSIGLVATRIFSKQILGH